MSVSHRSSRSILFRTVDPKLLYDRVPFASPVLSARTTLFQEKSMCQI